MRAERRHAQKLYTELAGPALRLDVEIVERLDVLGEEPERRPNQMRLTRARRRLERFAHAGAEPFAAVGALALVAEARRVAELALDRGGRRAHEPVVRIAALRDGSRQAVRREHDRCAFGAVLGRLLAHERGVSAHELGLLAPGIGSNQLDRAARGVARFQRCVPIDVLAERGERDHDQAPQAESLGAVERPFDARLPEPHADQDRRLEPARQSVRLLAGVTKQRRAADGFVARAKLVDETGRHRSPLPDPSEECRQLVEIFHGAVGDEQHAGVGGQGHAGHAINPAVGAGSENRAAARSFV